MAMVRQQILVPYTRGEIVTEIHRGGVVESEEFTEAGTRLTAHLPLALASRLEGLGLLEALEEPPLEALPEDVEALSVESYPLPE